MIKDFIKLAEMPQEVVEKYQNQIPEELLRIWQEDGLGTFLNGYLKVINPDDYLGLIQETYFRGNVSIPIFATAFGDIITFEENKYLGLLEYKNGNFDIFTENLHYFLNDLSDVEFQEEYFELPLYYQAVEQHGHLDYNQCFGFVPLLALGGPKEISHLSKVKIFEHILLITQLAGGIGD